MSEIIDPEKEYYKTYQVKDRHDKRLGDIAWWERKEKKEVVQEALDLYLSTKKDVPMKPQKAA